MGGMQRRWARGVNRGHIKEQDKKRVRLLRIELKQMVKTVSADMLEVSRVCCLDKECERPLKYIRCSVFSNASL